MVSLSCIIRWDIGIGWRAPRAPVARLAQVYAGRRWTATTERLNSMLPTFDTLSKVAKLMPVASRADKTSSLSNFSSIKQSPPLYLYDSNTRTGYSRRGGKEV